MLDLATSVLPYLALSFLMYRLMDVSYLLVLLVSIPAAGFLVRSFIMFHDCSHGSFLPRSGPTSGWVPRSGCSSTRRSCAGATTTRSTTRPRATSSVAGAVTFAR